jgi:hypothetical protein
MKHAITLEQAVELTGNFRANPAADVATCETFEMASVMRLLAVSGAHSLRIYSGRKENGQICAVMCAADEQGNDLLPEANKPTSEDDEDCYIILEDSSRCPELCPPASPLNP